MIWSPGKAADSARATVVLCVVVAAVLAVARLDEVLGLFDWRADQNDSRGYLERLYGDEAIAGSRRVVQDAIAWMPADANYRVVVGPRLRSENRFTSALAPDFLKYYLLPRRQTQSTSARWVFCYGCEPAALGPRFRVLSAARNGVAFGRVDG